MPDLSIRTDVERTPVIYAGRFVDEIPDADVAGDCIVLDKQDALPHKLAGVLERANALVLLDLLSFPLEAMTDDHWDLPIVVVIPSGFDSGRYAGARTAGSTSGLRAPSPSRSPWTTASSR